tara:strand:+ start:4349 stop:6106 length:1758 start_codon:yes stop_codon:yes gene_type:complete
MDLRGPVKLSLSACVALFFSMPNSAFAQNWMAHSTVYSEWVETKRDCSEWLPSVDKFDWGVPVRQSATCRITTNRFRKMMEKNPVNGELRERESARKEETRVLLNTAWRTETGTNDRVLQTVREESWGEWRIDRDSIGQCEPVIGDVSDKIDWGNLWVQMYECVADGERSKPVTQYWLSGKTTRLKDEEEKENLPVTVYESFVSVGMNDRWLKPEPKYQAWSEKSEDVCGEWSKDALSIAEKQPWGSPVMVPRVCEQDLTRLVVKEERSLSGKVREVSRDVEHKSKTRTEWRVEYGMQDQVAKNLWESDKEWDVMVGDMDCKPLFNPDFVPFGTLFININTCNVTEFKRHKNVDVMRSGKRVVKEVRDETRDAKREIVFLDAGRKDKLIEDAVATRKTEWQHDGGKNCNGWSPVPLHVPNGDIFIQTRACTQNQRRHTETLSKWTSGDRWVASGQEYREITSTDVRYATGMKLRRQSFPDVGVTVAGGETKLGTPVVLKGIDKYSRLRVSVDVQGSVDTLSISLVGPKGKTISLPALSKTKQSFFFSLSDYALTVDGEWQVKVSDSGSDTARRVGVSLSFEETRD